MGNPYWPLVLIGVVFFRMFSKDKDEFDSNRNSSNDGKYFITGILVMSVLVVALYLI